MMCAQHCEGCAFRGSQHALQERCYAKSESLHTVLNPDCTPQSKSLASEWNCSRHPVARDVHVHTNWRTKYRDQEARKYCDAQCNVRKRVLCKGRLPVCLFPQCP